MKQYIVVCERAEYHLSKQVESYLNDDWKLAGGVSAHNNDTEAEYCQALVFYADE